MSPCTSRNSCSKKGAGCSTCNVGLTSAPLAEAKVTQDSAIAATFGRIKNTIFVMSGKGGVGKSMVTVNLAVALAQRGYHVGILDVDLHGPSVPGLLGITQKLTTSDSEILTPVERGTNLRVLSMDSLLPDSDTAIIWRGPKKSTAIRQFLSGVAWGDLDFLLIDSPPGTGDEHLAILQTVPAAQCLMVTTPQEISLADVRKALQFLKKIDANLLGLVENMSGFSCPHCGGHIDLFAKDGGKELANKHHIPFLGAIPLDALVSVAADTGKPIVEFTEPSVAKDAFIALAEKISLAVNNT